MKEFLSKEPVKRGIRTFIQAARGYIVVNATSTNAVLEVIEVTTMPDGSDAIKFVAL